MSVGCFFFPHFPLQVESRGNPSLQGHPVIIGGFPHQRKTVIDASEKALASGISQDMPLRQAYSLCPEAIFLPADDEQHRKAFDGILCLLETFSSTVEDAGAGLAFIENPFETAAAEYISHLRHTIKDHTDFTLSASCASGKIIAHIAARVAASESMIAIPGGKEAQFLADLPIGFLPGPAEVMRRLALLGITRIGQLASLPRSAVSEEFGLAGGYLWDLANGIDRSALVPRQTPQRIDEVLCFESAVADRAQLIAGAKIMVNRLAVQLNRRWQCCGRMTLCLVMENGHIIRDTVEFKVATSSPTEILRQVCQRLELIHFNSSISEIHINLSDTCSEKGSQINFMDERSIISQDLLNTINRLQHKYRQPVIKRLVPGKSNSRLPEKAFSLADF